MLILLVNTFNCMSDAVGEFLKLDVVVLATAYELVSALGRHGATDKANGVLAVELVAECIPARTAFPSLR